MALKISITVHDVASKDAKDRFGVKLMEALAEFDSGVEMTVNDGITVAYGSGRIEDSVQFLCNTFGMGLEEARELYLQLERQRCRKLAAELGRVSS